MLCGCCGSGVSSSSSSSSCGGGGGSSRSSRSSLFFFVFVVLLLVTITTEKIVLLAATETVPTITKATLVDINRGREHAIFPALVHLLARAPSCHSRRCIPCHSDFTLVQFTEIDQRELKLRDSACKEDRIGLDRVHINVKRVPRRTNAPHVPTASCVNRRWHGG